MNPELLATLQSSIVVGRYGELQLEKGWHEREADGRFGIPYRASGAEADIVLRAVPGAQRLNLLVSGPVGVVGHPLEVRLVFNRKKFELPLPIDGWVLRSFPLEVKRETLKIRVEMSSPIVPDLILRNGDARPLGLFLSAIWQE
ncbi:hypothetical protein BH09SUM1_BH09SUM1_03780 [soil metagenome]